MKVLCNKGKQPFVNRQGTVEKKQAYYVEVVDAKGTHRTTLPVEYVEPDALTQFNERVRTAALAHSKQKGKTNVGDPLPKGRGKSA